MKGPIGWTIIFLKNREKKGPSAKPFWGDAWTSVFIFHINYSVQLRRILTFRDAEGDVMMVI